MPKLVDARGLSCPQPVVLARKALEEADEVIVVVGEEAAAQNVKRMAESLGCEVKVQKQADGFHLHLKHIKTKAEGIYEAPGARGVLVISSDCMGRGEEELGRLLMRAFLHTLTELPQIPQKAIFFNRGVKLVVEGSEALNDLKALEEKGIEILACGTCLDYFGLKDRIKVGKVSNMYEIAEALVSAQRLIVL